MKLVMSNQLNAALECNACAF